VRIGLIGKALKANGWGLVVAGASVRYRARIRPFQRFELRTRVVGWDDRFVYIEQGDVAGRHLLSPCAFAHRGHREGKAGADGACGRGDERARDLPATARLGAGLDGCGPRATLAARGLKPARSSRMQR
jgi:hypothetical protein